METAREVFRPRSTAFSPQGIVRAASTRNLEFLAFPTFPEIDIRASHAVEAIERAGPGQKGESACTEAIAYLRQVQDREATHRLVALALKGEKHVAARAIEAISDMPHLISQLRSLYRREGDQSCLSTEARAELFESVGSQRDHPVVASGLFHLACNYSYEAARALRGFDDEFILEKVVNRLNGASKSPSSLEEFGDQRALEFLPLALHGFNDLRAIDTLTRCITVKRFQLSALRALGGVQEWGAQEILIQALVAPQEGCIETQWKTRYAASEALCETLPFASDLGDAITQLAKKSILDLMPTPVRLFVYAVGALGGRNFPEQGAQMKAGAAIAIRDYQPDLAKEVLESIRTSSVFCQHTIRRILSTLP